MYVELIKLIIALWLLNFLIEWLSVYFLCHINAQRSRSIQPPYIDEPRESVKIDGMNKTSQNKRVQIEHAMENEGDVMTDAAASLPPTEVKFAPPNTKLVKPRLFLVPIDGKYDIPHKLEELVMNKTRSSNIRAELNKLIPSELSFSTYKQIFRNLVHLDELGIWKSFQNYAKNAAYFRPKNSLNAGKGEISRLFTLKFEGLHEIRPSILSGDAVEATNIQTNTVFAGIVRIIRQDEMDIEFEDHFSKLFEATAAFKVTFSYSRGVYIKMHIGVERAVQQLGESFLFPNEIVMTHPAQLNAQLDGGALKLDDVEIPWFKADIDDSQKMAVAQVLRAEFRPLPNIIYGPPGTGKTSTLVEIILQIFTHLPKSRILIAAHSNSAANLILIRLLEYDFVRDNIVRLLGITYGEKKVISEDLHGYCASLHTMTKYTDDMNEAEEVEMKNGVKIFHHLDCLAPFRIVIGTCVGLGPLLYDRNGCVPDYSHVFVDEAGQCSEPEVLIPISRVNKTNGSVVLAGDPMQMSPLVLSQHAKERGLAVSLLSRLVERYTNIENKLMLEGIENRADLRLISKLLYNYRSLPSVLQFYNQHFYNNELRATISDSDSPEADILTKIQEIMPRNGVRNVWHGIYFHNIIGTNQQIKGSTSWFNTDENSAILTFVSKLMEIGFTSEDIGVIAPYQLQVKILRQLFDSKNCPILVGSVDQFQGLERKIIAISTVRTNSRKVMMDIRQKMGIVACAERTNVAISRARALVVVFGRADILRKDYYWRALIEDCEKNGTFFE